MQVIRRTRTLRAGIKKTIHVVGANVRAGKQGRRPSPPCFTVHCVDGTFHCRGFRADVTGVQSFTTPLTTGAVVWLTTTGPVEMWP
jgi:hypothetical protein